MRDVIAPAFEEGFFEVGGGFYVRRMWHRKSERRDEGHKHFIDHVGNLVCGKVRVHWSVPETGECGVIEMLQPGKINVLAGRHHRVEVIEDAFWECWFSKAEADRIYGDFKPTHDITLEAD